MKGDAKVIEYLNEALKNELTAVNQYWLHYRMLDNWGVSRLAHFERHESIDEMKHADKLSERILFLDGLPNFQMLGRLRIGETVEEILKADLELEYEALPLLKDAIAHFACHARAIYDGGDHIIVVGEILDFDHKEGDALIFYRGQMQTSAPL